MANSDSIKPYLVQSHYKKEIELDKVYLVNIIKSTVISDTTYSVKVLSEDVDVCVSDIIEKTVINQIKKDIIKL